MFKIATPISELFANSTDALEIIGATDCLECRDAGINAEIAGQELFHCEIQPIHELKKDDFSYLGKIAGIKPDLKLISFHAASSCDKPYVNEYMFQSGGRQYSRGEMLCNAKINFSRIKMIFDASVKIAIENNNYYPTEAYRYVTDADFICEIVKESDISFLFDVAHGRVTSHNRKLAYEDYKRHLPLDKMVQIHLCQSGVDENGLAYDAHQLPGKEEWAEVRSLIQSYPGVEYLTIEYYKEKNNLIESLKKAKKVRNELSRTSVQVD